MKKIVFSKEDIEFIERHYMTQSDRWIGQHIGRSKDSIYSKRQVLNLMRYNNNTSLKRPDYTLEYLCHQEISTLVHFIETTKSEVWRDIANRRRKDLIHLLKKIT